MERHVHVTVNSKKVIGPIDPRLYGSFVEHLGRAVYTGLYEPGHPTADEDGFREDVLALVRELGVPVVRYPGGNFVSNYYWEDGVGPERKKRLDLAWRTLEPNEFGVSEFAAWCRKAGTEPMMAVNLGTRGVSAALNLLEYCNLDTDSYYASLRKGHGDTAPYDVKLWCMGNEMDGPWQIGHKDATEYGKLACETAKAMKMMDPSIETVVCGSSGQSMPTFGAWEREVLRQSYEVADYISLHTYWSNASGDTPEFFAKSIDLDSFIRTVIGICDEVKAEKGSNKDINLSFDEWNVWYHSLAQDNEDMRDKPWRLHPHLLEDVYTFEDAIVDGLALITFLKHADRVKIACLAQLVNVIAPIMTEEGGGAFKQTIFYPFYHASRYGRGISLDIDIDSSVHATSGHAEVPDVDAACVFDTIEDQITVFAVNRCLDSSVPLTLSLEGFEGYRPVLFEALESDDLKAVNSFEEEKVKPTVKDLAGIKSSAIGQLDDVATQDSNASMVANSAVWQVDLAPASWNVIVFRK